MIFSVFFGVALTSTREKGAPIVRGVEALVRVMLQLTDYVMRFAPFAVFTAVTSALAERGPEIITTLGKFVGSFSAGRHTLDASNIPFLGQLVDKFTGGNVFLCEVYFVTTRELPSAPLMVSV